MGAQGGQSGIGRGARFAAAFAMIKLFRKLDNPFLLIAEGFVAGAILFWSTSPGPVDAKPNHPTARAESPATSAARL